MIERFMDEMFRVEKLIQKKIVWRGLVNSFAQTAPMLAYAYALYYGSHLIASKELHFKNVIKLVKTHCVKFMFEYIYKNINFFFQGLLNSYYALVSS